MAERMQDNLYSAEDITALEGMEAVRLRPGMYIGGVDSTALHHLVYEIVDNSIDEALVGYCSEISVVIHRDDSITIQDNGRGIPVEVHKESGLPAAELVMTQLHAGGKFDKKSYKVSSGLNGVGASVVNALSEKLLLEVKRDGHLWRQTFAQGKSTSKMERLEPTERTGTKTSFAPDKTIFDNIDFNFDLLSQRLRELAFLNRGIRINIRDERTEKSHEFKYDGGIVSFIQFLNKSRTTLHRVQLAQQRVTPGSLASVMSVPGCITQEPLPVRLGRSVGGEQGQQQLASLVPTQPLDLLQLVLHKDIQVPELQ